MSLRLLSVTSELHPLIKTGGLADVAGALPVALAGHGVEVRSLFPAYPQVLRAIAAAQVKAKPVHSYKALFGGPARLLAAKLNGLDLLLLDSPHLFAARDGGPYSDLSGHDWGDNWRRFAALSAVAADVAAGAVKGWRADVVHAHDWQAAMAAAYVRHGRAPETPVVVTIHNLAFQGRFDAGIFPDLGLPASAFAVDGVEYYGGVGFLKAGLQYADAITTVSPTYADEIRTPAFGMGLDGLLRGRGSAVQGIVNGIDSIEWDPSTDPHIAGHFSARSLGPRITNRRAIEKRFALKRGKGPVFALISRLTWQKGIDLIVDAVEHIVAHGGRLTVLGSGDSAFEGALLAAADRHRGLVGVVNRYDEPLAHLMQAGCDAILIPSRFEPCGLTQLYGLRYGTIPVAARTGGLADTIVDANEAALTSGCATGILHQPASGDALKAAISRAIDLYWSPDLWQAMRRQGMRADYGWGRSSARYAALYRSLVDRSKTT
ncbi:MULTISPECIES: glycogen synthase GlgA [unclassified Sphingomonas]|uniref:glycogen synthase GlgA n=1 Tax=unclassified Sphingomonas TaxID=196159 RepID=UPI0006F4674C|nr:MULTISPECIES: glycogen synthase GlgA [unclassified Sphingomonas]KQX18361.1 glycogen synthase [Sphingomonas sp. Root1294]KQY72314.1 glycogen synthase [Sphingomonas sp. Root50]KRB94414.1 glycogen synthase [Sphingomonas sp. Root720]